MTDIPPMWQERYAWQDGTQVVQNQDKARKNLPALKPAPYTIRTKLPTGSCPGNERAETCIGGKAEWSGFGPGRARLGVVTSCRNCGRGRYVNVEIRGLPGHTANIRLPSMPKPAKKSGNTAPWITAGPDPRLGGAPRPGNRSERLAIYPNGSPSWAVVVLARRFTWPLPVTTAGEVGERTWAVGLSDAVKPFERGAGAEPFTPDNILEGERRFGRWRSSARWRRHE